MMTFDEAVARDPQVMSGALCFRGTRVLVQTLFDYIEEGHPLERFLRGFPGVSKAQAEAVLRASAEEIERKPVLKASA
jgi:uncharacterized protein (DUF433 family)